MAVEVTHGVAGAALPCRRQRLALVDDLGQFFGRSSFWKSGIVQPGVRRMRPVSVSTIIQRQSTRASFSPVSLVMVVSRSSCLS